MENRKGFALSGIIYSLLILFLVLVLNSLNNLQNKKQILDQLKLDTVNAIDQPWQVELANLQTQINNLNKKVIDLEQKEQYPIGSIYMSVKNENPSIKFGGTWVAWGNGKVPVGVDTNQSEFNTVEKTGGAMTHNHGTGNFTLTENELPTRNLRVGINGDFGNYDGGGSLGGWGVANAGVHNKGIARLFVQGGNQPHNHGYTSGSYNLSPYITCYMWKRIG